MPNKRRKWQMPLRGESDLQNTIAMCLRSKGLALYMMGQVEQGLTWLQKALHAYRDH